MAPRASDLGLSPVDHPEHWERYYAQVAAPEDMPWFCAGLDPDVAQALEAHDIAPGARVLDLGTGPANQAFELARRGYRVVGSDLAPSAIARAREHARALELDVEFHADDILATALQGPFDAILDRGCFHCLFAEVRATYAANVARLLAPRGRFLQKTFSHRDAGTEGPYRFRPDELDAAFAGQLERLALVDTTYQGTMEENPIALFTVWGRSA